MLGSVKKAINNILTAKRMVVYDDCQNVATEVFIMDQRLMVARVGIKGIIYKLYNLRDLIRVFDAQQAIEKTENLQAPIKQFIDQESYTIKALEELSKAKRMRIKRK